MNRNSAQSQDPRFLSATAEGVRVVGVFAHPDDESYWAGGMLAWWAQQRARVQVICLTHGELWVSWMKSRTSQASSRLPDRLLELKQACQILGVEPPTIFDFGDGQLDRNWHTKVGLLARVLARQQPQVVITTGPDGVYGHRDHIACNALVCAALDTVDPKRAIRLLHTAFPKGLFLSTYRSLHSAKPSISAQLKAEQIGVDLDSTDLELELTTLTTIKKRAIRAHASQQGSFKTDILDWLLQKERFVLARGPGFGTLAPDPLLALARKNGT